MSDEKFRCKSRPVRDEAMDEWRVVGRDRVCSYCGSLHPEDFEKILDEAAKPDGRADVDLTNKGYKIYAKWCETMNAGDGGIKFYGWHLDEADLDRINEKIGEAYRASMSRLHVVRRREDDVTC